MTTRRREPGSADGALRRVKLVHTLIWAFFAGCVLAIPVLGWTGHYGLAAMSAAVVMVEVVVLVLNDWTCPLTGVAARYTDDRRENFDIYLPRWLARHNKRVFGFLYVAGIVMTVMLWIGEGG